MALTGDQKIWLYGSIVVTIYISILFIFINQVQIIFERTILLVFLATGISLIISMSLSSAGINMKKFRFLPIEVYGIKMSITFFLLSIIILKLLII